MSTGPDFLNGAKLSEIYWLEERSGFTTITRGSDSEQLRALAERGRPSWATVAGPVHRSTPQMTAEVVFMLEERSIE